MFHIQLINQTLGRESVSWCQVQKKWVKTVYIVVFTAFTAPNNNMNSACDLICPVGGGGVCRLTHLPLKLHKHLQTQKQEAFSEIFNWADHEAL